VEGRWQAELLVRLPGRDDARTAFRFQVTATSATEEGGSQAAPVARPSELGMVTLAALGLVLLGLGLLVYVARVLGLRSLEGRTLAVASVVVIGLGVFLALRAQPAGTLASQDVRAMRNPYAPTQESLAIGQRIYGESCATCHGVSGRGDGPAAAVLNPRPADLRVHMAAGHTDGELFTWLSEGVEGTAMPAFKDQLSEEERWHIINYIRTFAGTQ
jgi:copper transport protein